MLFAKALNMRKYSKKRKVPFLFGAKTVDATRPVCEDSIIFWDSIFSVLNFLNFLLLNSSRYGDE